MCEAYDQLLDLAKTGGEEQGGKKSMQFFEDVDLGTVN